jgi:two-component system, NarL family, response regulator NreC
VCPHGQIRDDGTIRCLLVHDHVLLRQGIRRLLEDEPDMQVEAEAGSAAEALSLVLEHRPHVVIADPRLFGRDAAICVESILSQSPNSKVLFLSAETEESVTAENVAPGRVLRQTSANELVELVRVLGTPELTSAKEKRHKQIAEWPTNMLSPRQRTLTVREQQVLKLLAEGRTVRSVASTLGLSVKTVDAHKFNLMRKLGIHNKAELVMWAIQKRVLKLPVNL